MAPSIRRLRDWALLAARPNAGEMAVDLGSGTGTIARELAGILGRTGSVIGVEPNPRLREISEHRAARSSRA